MAQRFGFRVLFWNMIPSWRCFRSNEMMITDVRLRLDMEKESKFEARIEAVKMAALRYEMQFWFDTRVQEMPVDDLPDLSPTNLQICFNDQNALGPEGEGDCSGASRGDVQQFQNHEQQVSVGV